MTFQWFLGWFILKTLTTILKTDINKLIAATEITLVNKFIPIFHDKIKNLFLKLIFKHFFKNKVSSFLLIIKWLILYENIIYSVGKKVADLNYHSVKIF